jgi:hypothetical protein
VEVKGREKEGREKEMVGERSKKKEER